MRQLTPTQAAQTGCAALGKGHTVFPGRAAASARHALPGNPIHRRPRTLARWAARHYAHKAGYHLARSPLYALRLAVRSPRGLLLLAAATGRYVTDAEGRPARSETATADKAELYLKCPSSETDAYSCAGFSSGSGPRSASS
jgi:hypothetical protein